MAIEDLLECLGIEIHKDMFDTNSLRQIVDNLHKPVKPDGYSAQLYVIDESPEILEKSEKENLWRKTNPMITTKRINTGENEDG